MGKTLHDIDAERINRQADRQWSKALESPGSKKLILWRVLLSLMGRDYVECVAFGIFIRLVSQSVAMEAMRRLLLQLESEAMEPKQADELPKLSSTVSWLIGIVLVFFSMFFCGFPLVKFVLTKKSLKSRVILTQLIRQKALRVQLSTNIAGSGSKAIGLISDEVNIIYEAHKWVTYTIWCPLTYLVGTCWMAACFTGWLPVLAMNLTTAILVAFQSYLPNLAVKLSAKRQAATYNCTSCIGSTLEAMRTIKLYNWESKFLSRIKDLRHKENRYLMNSIKYLALEQGVTLLFGAVLVVVTLLTALLVDGKGLEGPAVVMTVTTIMVLRAESFVLLPIGHRHLCEAMEALQRVQKYLLETEEKLDQRVVCKMATDRLLAHDMSAAYVKSSDAGKEKAKPIITGLEMDLCKGELVLVVGPVGSGKSTLLTTILGEATIISGLLAVSKDARLAYAPQEPCVWPQSIKNNIISGRPLDMDRYERVLDVCALRPDLKLMAEGDLTLVGTKGVTLSGGQRARVSLARALYSEAEIYLLDDPLSALDSRVAREIFDKAVRRFLADKLVLLATHQVHLLPLATKVMRMQADGKPSCCLANEVGELDTLFGENEASVDELAPAKTQELAQSEQAEVDPYALVGAREQPSPYLYPFKIGAGILAKVGLICLGALLLVSVAATFLLLQRLGKRSVSTASYVDKTQDLYVFALASVLAGLMPLIFEYSFVYYLRLGVQLMHEKMVSCLVAAKISFYDYCDAGNLSSRFASDFAIIDQAFVHLYTTAIVLAIESIGAIAATTWLNGSSVSIFLVAILLDVYLCRRMQAESRRLMQVASHLRGPTFSFVTTAIDNLVTLRSDKNLLLEFEGKYNEAENRCSAAHLVAFAYKKNLEVSLAILNSIAVAGAVLVLILTSDQLDSASMGTFLMANLLLVRIVPVVIEQVSYIEHTIPSFRNVIALTYLEPEEEQPRVEDKVVPLTSTDTKTIGQLEFRGVSLRYAADKRLVLHSLSFVIGAGERVGVVGRTGAGKSSLVSVIYRLYPFDGSVLIDGRDTKSMTLEELRQSLAVIPQEPVIFCDSLRNNLDPFGQHSDEQIWQVLEVVNLRLFVRTQLGSLESQISEKGRNLSFGQRQLVCLARALLRKPKVLLIDEATANVDHETDTLIQATIRRHFTNTTTITIAHRLNTVMDCHRIMVLDGGKVAEFDSPEELLNKENGIFKAMYQQTSCKK